MNLQQQEEQFKALYDHGIATMLKKGNDYAGEDRLNNFKTTAAICGISPALSCLVLIATKVTRLTTLLNSGKAPENESVEDSAKDLFVYTALLNMVLYEMATQGKTFIELRSKCGPPELVELATYGDIHNSFSKQFIEQITHFEDTQVWNSIAKHIAKSKGESGRELFHDFSKIFPGYTFEDCEIFYTNRLIEVIKEKNSNDDLPF